MGAISFILLVYMMDLYTAHTAEYCQHMTSTSRNSAIKQAFVTGERVNIDTGTNFEKNKHEN